MAKEPLPQLHAVGTHRKEVLNEMLAEELSFHDHSFHRDGEFLSGSPDPGISSVSARSVTSIEPEAGCGPEDEEPDVMGADIGQADTQFEVRAERCGEGSGRTYTVVYDVKDHADNTSRVQATIVVPHDQGM